MGNAIAFDTHVYVKKLKAAGFTEEQAEILASTQAELIDDRLATKNDLKELDLAHKRDIKELETALKRDMKELETGLKHDMKELELRLKHDLTLRLGGMMAASIALVAALVKLL
ncbi:MAG: DUF1640 domain-containing protein [Nitrospinae bacterium]|nr:DUF1640 domain-containing protein [Nitrospinota bacterium]